MVDMSASSTRAGHLPKAQHQGLAERLAIWVLVRSERRRSEELERVAWDLEARCERRSAAMAHSDRRAVLPPGGRLF